MGWFSYNKDNIFTEEGAMAYSGSQTQFGNQSRP
jgi:hypothetical protein